MKNTSNNAVKILLPENKMELKIYAGLSLWK